LESIRKLIKVSIIEGISLIILFFIAMPLKYIWGYKIATLIFGSIHGILWLYFLKVLYDAKKEHNFNNKLVFELILFSVIPFGFIAMERKLSKLI